MTSFWDDGDRVTALRRNLEEVLSYLEWQVDKHPGVVELVRIRDRMVALIGQLGDQTAEIAIVEDAGGVEG